RTAQVQQASATSQVEKVQQRLVRQPNRAPLRTRHIQPDQARAVVTQSRPEDILPRGALSHLPPALDIPDNDPARCRQERPEARGWNKKKASVGAEDSLAGQPARSKRPYNLSRGSVHDVGRAGAVSGGGEQATVGKERPG